MRTLLADLRYAFRMLRKNPGMTAAAVLTLSLGIGANAAIFSLIDGLLLRPLPYKDSGRLVLISESSRQTGPAAISESTFLEIETRCTSLESVAALDGASAVIAHGSQPDRVSLSRVSAGFFDVIGVNPSRGRGIRREEFRDGAGAVAVLTDAFWTRAFGRDTNVIGRVVTLDDSPHTVIGVLPPDFRFFRRADVFVPLHPRPGPAESGRNLLVLARLAPGVAPDRARAEIEAIAANAVSSPEWRASVAPLHETLVRGPRNDLPVLMTAAALVLLIACANVAGLLLAKSAGRQHEIAVRVALGAGRARLIRQLLTESVLMAAAGGAGGVLIAAWAVNLLRARMAELMPHAGALAINPRILCFTAGLSVLTGIVFGLAPALRGTRSALLERLKQGGRDAAGSVAGSRLRSALVVAEVALSVVLVAGAGLMMRALSAATQVRQGFDGGRILTMKVALPPPRYPDPRRAARFFAEALDRTAALHGVRASALATALPYRDWVPLQAFHIPGRPQPPSSPSSAHFIAVSPDYFQILGARLLRGRQFTVRDNLASAPVAVVNETFARRFLAGTEPLGAGIRTAKDELFEIVGVVGTFESAAAPAEAPAIVFLSYSQRPAADCSLLVLSAAADASTLATASTAAIRSIDKDQPVTDIATLAAVRGRALLVPRVLTGFMAAFGGFAMLLAMIGVYGMASYNATLRTREIGIRIALGATEPQVLRLVVKRSLLITIAGVGLGIGGAAAAARLLRGLLFGVPAQDSVMLIAMAAVLAATTLWASYIPARRALRVDPLEALRCE